MKRAMVVGILVGILLMCQVFMLSAAGEGTAWPATLYFAPAAILIGVGNISPSATILVTLWILISGPLIYGAYGGYVAGARSAGSGKQRVIRLLIFHYACFAVSSVFVYDEGTRRLARIWPFMWWLLVVSFLIFVSAHVLIVRFALHMTGSR